MQLIIAAVGHKMPDWIETGFHEYAKRMPAECRLVLKEIKPAERSSGRSAETVMAQERTRIEAVLPKGGRLVALDERGLDLTTMQLSQHLTQWQQQGGDVTFVVGGADGLDPALKKCRHAAAHIEHDAAARSGPRDARGTVVPSLVDHA